MKYIVILLALLAFSPIAVLAQLVPEQVFGANIQSNVWNSQIESEYMGEYFKTLRMPNAAANIIFVNEIDTTEFIFLLDNAVDYLRWYRIRWQAPKDSLVFIGHCGLDDSMEYSAPNEIAINSETAIYNTETDNIFVVARMRQYMFKQQFHFNPADPTKDNVFTEDSIRVDTLFRPFDIKYIQYSHGALSWNRLFVLDQYRSCFFVFTRAGDLLGRLNFEPPDDSIFHDYAGFTYRLNNNGTINFYIIDWPQSKVVGYCYNPHNDEISKFGEIALINGELTNLSDIVYYAPEGLWVFDRRYNLVMSVAEDLSQVNRYINIDSLGLAGVEKLGYMSVLDGHIVLMGIMGENSGIYSFTTGYHALKPGKNPNIEVPTKYALDQNYPNPFNPNTLISYAIPKQSYVKLDIYNILGQRVITLVDDEKPAGYYSVTWNSKNSEGREVASGLYFYRISARDFTEIKKMTLIK